MTELSPSDMPLPRHVLHDLGFFGHYLHMNAGGRSGQQHLLVKLFRNDGHMTQRDLQEAAGISSGSMSEVVAKLEAAGLIVRTRCDEDRRQQEITLTDSGRGRAEELIEKRRAFEGECLACLDDDERQQLVVLLDRLVEHWKGIEGKEACA